MNDEIDEATYEWGRSVVEGVVEGLVFDPSLFPAEPPQMDFMTVPVPNRTWSLDGEIPTHPIDIDDFPLVKSQN